MDSRVPHTIGRYEIDRRLGSGAMGHVYLGRDPELDRPVAIKVVRDLGLGDKQLSVFLERFRNEARAAARLSHPAIVQVYDVGEDSGAGPYLVFEYVAGSTLRQVLQATGPLSAEKVVRLADEIAGALDLAHESEIIHRDIKPDNLLIRPDGSTKLADFGVARIPNAALTREGQFLGTPAYAAPETLQEGSYGPASDIFSLGAVLYEALTGVRPWAGDDALAVAHQVIHEEPAPPCSVARGDALPKAVDRVLLRVLSKNPEERYQSAAQLAAALADALEPNGSRALPKNPSPRRSASVLPLFAVLIGLLALGTAMVLAFQNEEVALSSDASASEDGEGKSDASLQSDGGSAPAMQLPSIPESLDAAHPADAGTEENETSAIDASSMTGYEREEAAKDALRRAQIALEAGDLAAARAAIAEARRLDSENSDIETLEDQVRQATEPRPEASPESSPD